jgi:hypothetical protein
MLAKYAIKNNPTVVEVSVVRAGAIALCALSRGDRRNFV